MVSRREQLVSRRDIVTKLWRSNLFIDTEPNINNIVRKIRTAMGDNSTKPRFLETVVGKGYRFIGPVRVIDACYPNSNFEHRYPIGIERERSSGWGERSSHCFWWGLLPMIRALAGFADALVSRLGNLQGVDVLPTSSVLNLPTAATASDIASRLGVHLRGPRRHSGIQRATACFVGNV